MRQGGGLRHRAADHADVRVAAGNGVTSLPGDTGVLILTSKGHVSICEVLTRVAVSVGTALGTLIRFWLGGEIAISASGAICTQPRGEARCG